LEKGSTAPTGSSWGELVKGGAGMVVVVVFWIPFFSTNISLLVSILASNFSSQIKQL
jgi:hypothetical protein